MVDIVRTLLGLEEVKDESKPKKAVKTKKAVKVTKEVVRRRPTFSKPKPRPEPEAEEVEPDDLDAE